MKPHTLILIVKLSSILPPLLLHIFMVSAIAAPPLRLATLSPLATELVVQLGLGDLIVTGVPSPILEQTQSLPSPGEWFSPSIERLVRHRVDWVVTNDGAISPGLRRGLDAAGIRLFVFAIREWQDLSRESGRFLLTIFSRPPPLWILAWEKCVKTQVQRIAAHNGRFSFLALVWGNPPIIFGRHTLISRLIESVGGTSLLPESVLLDYPQVSLEWISRNRPAVLLVLDEFFQTETAENLTRRFWKSPAPAVRVLPSRFFARSSFAMMDHLEQLSLPLSTAADSQDQESSACEHP